MNQRIISIFGRAVFVFSLISLFLPSYYLFPYLLIYWIGIFLNLAAGILYLIGINRIGKPAINVGFGIGLIAWSFLLIITSYGIIWSSTAIYDTNYIYVFSGMYFMMPGFYPVRYLSFYGSIVHLPLVMIGAVCGLIVFFKWQHELFVIEEKITECPIPREQILDILREKDNITKYSCPNCHKLIYKDSNYCSFCGSNLKT